MECCDVQVLVENDPIAVAVEGSDSTSIVVDGSPIHLHCDDGSDLMIIVDTSDVVLFTVAEQGPPGPPGAALSFVCAEPITAFRAVAVNNAGLAVHASATVDAHGHSLQGIAEVSAQAGNPLAVKNSGCVTNPSWNWAAGPILLGINGQLVQSVLPGSLFTCTVGWGNGQLLVIRLGPPVYIRN